MRVLLVGMPDTVSALDAILKVPNLGLCSIAGNLTNCEVRIIDLAFFGRGLTRVLQKVVADFEPDLVGLSAMSYQYASARRAAQVCRSARSEMKIALGGYHASLMHREIGNADADYFDFVVRGEGETTFSHLAESIRANDPDYAAIPGLSYRVNGEFRHNPPARPIDLASLKLPNRSARVADRAHFLGQPFDCVETSRGCSQRCRFCSIREMYGSQVRSFSLDRVVEDLKRLKEAGKRGVFFVDDNITLDVARLKSLCQSIIDEKLDDRSYTVQASVVGIASDPELPALMKRSGFKWVFLGIESGIRRNLESMGKKGVLPNVGKAVSGLRAHGIGVFGGFIVGHPDDSLGDISTTFKYALESGVDHPIIQCLTPYPRTQTRQELADSHLITNADDFSLYNGFTCNIRTRKLPRRQLNRAIFWNGLRLYFHPRYLSRSRFWRFRATVIPALLANNLSYLAGSLTGKVFISRHKW